MEARPITEATPHIVKPQRREEIMKRTMLTLAAGCLALVPAATSLNAQGDAPQSTCRMCPGVYIPASELQAYVNKAIAEKRVDQQVRDVDIGKSNVAIGLVYRGKLDAPAPESVAEHDQVSEVYHIIETWSSFRPAPDTCSPKSTTTSPTSWSGSTPTR
jgi:hypothetical protein